VARVSPTVTRASRAAQPSPAQRVDAVVDRRARSSLETLPVGRLLAFLVAALVLGLVAAALPSPL
jgi:hypothetical protein